MTAIAADPGKVDEDFAPLTGPYRGYAMGLLLAIAIVNYIDRQVVNILAEPIKRDLGLADWQLGMLTGLAFGLLYTVLGLPIARLAERGNRPLIIAAAAATWSGFTALCGAAQSFAQLALARVGVGIGEAGCTPPSHSLIMDYTAPARRGSALAFYGLGGPLGGLIGLAFGGLVADALGWRAAFLMAGLPGLLFAVLVATTLREPRRARKETTPVVARASIADMLRLAAGKRSYWLLCGAITANVCIVYGQGAFIASFYFRNHGVELGQAVAALDRMFGIKLGVVGLMGLTLGLLTGLFAAISTLVGGRLADRLGPGDPRRYLYLPAGAALLGAPLFVAAVTVPTLGLSLILFGLYVLIGHSWYGPAYTAWFSLVPAHMRATNSALSLFLANLLGLGVTPLAVGLLSDTLAARLGADEGLRWALAALAGVGILAAALFWSAARTFRTDIEG